MTTKRQIKKLLKPFLEKHDDLELVGQWIYLKPAQHLARAVLIDRTSDADYFKPRWALVNLCHPWDSFHLSWGEELYRPRNKPGLWLWSDSSMPNDLYSKIETEALPALRAVETLHQFLDFACNPENFNWPPRLLNDRRAPLEKIIVDAAIGDFDAALEGCINLTTKRNWNQDPEWKREYDAVTKQLFPLLQANDRKGIAKLLHEWEAFTVEQFGITQIWEKTPFPFEEG